MTATPGTVWRNRIVGTGEVDPSELVANPANWRQHPMQQREALADALERVGWVQQVVVNKTTGRMIDGHLRAQLGDEQGEATVPVLYVELTEEEERLVLASLDPIGALAVPDVEQLRKLLDSLPALADAPALDGLLDDLLGQYLSTTPDRTGPVATERDFWPVIRLQVSYDTLRAFETWWGELDGEDDDQKLRGVVDAQHRLAAGE